MSTFAQFAYPGKAVVIAGSMKCGTTILYDYLCANPLVKGFPGKEAHYFSLEYERMSFQDYLSCFGDAEDGILCDASPTYFDCADRMPTLERLKAQLPGVVIVVLLRDPVERALSHFNHLKTVDKINLLQGVEADDFFSAYDRVVESPYAEYLGDVIDFSFCHHKLLSLYETFDPGQIVVVDNSVLSAHPVDLMRQIYSRLRCVYYHSAIYGSRNYMSGTDLSCISARLRNRLVRYFELDYQRSLKLCTALT